MALEKAGDILRDAYKNEYGIAAFNVLNSEMIKIAIYQAEEMQHPVIIACYPGFKDIIDIDVVLEVTKAYAKKVKIPIGIHLDHSTDYAEIMRAMHMGYTSVMYDGSALPFEENIKNTAEVVKVAKTLGVDVEAELGHVGDADNVSDFSDSSSFTSPEDAAVFLERTGCSYLAVAVGNAHGNYVQLPNIDIKRIQAISDMVKIPLVLHGGSGIPDAQVRAAVWCGIAKINVGTEYFSTYYRTLEFYQMSEKSGKEMPALSALLQRDIMAYLKVRIDAIKSK